MPCLTLARNMGLKRLKFLVALCMSANDHESAACTDFVVKKFSE